MLGLGSLPFLPGFESPSSPQVSSFDSLPLHLPDGSTLNYHGDPSLIPDIYDTKTGAPVPLAPARPGSDPVDIGKFFPELNFGGLGLGASSVSSSAAKTIFGFDAGDVVSIVLGLLFIGMGLLFFEQVREPFIEGVRSGAAIAA